MGGAALATTDGALALGAAMELAAVADEVLPEVLLLAAPLVAVGVGGAAAAAAVAALVGVVAGAAPEAGNTNGCVLLVGLPPGTGKPAAKLKQSSLLASSCKYRQFGLLHGMLRRK